MASVTMPLVAAAAAAAAVCVVIATSAAPTRLDSDKWQTKGDWAPRFTYAATPICLPTLAAAAAAAGVRFFYSPNAVSILTLWDN